MGQYKCHHVAATLLFGYVRPYSISRFSPKFVSKYIEENAHNIQQVNDFTQNERHLKMNKKRINPSNNQIFKSKSDFQKH